MKLFFLNLGQFLSIFMKNYFFLLVLSASSTIAQWFEKTSCNKNEEKIMHSSCAPNQGKNGIPQS